MSHHQRKMVQDCVFAQSSVLTKLNPGSAVHSLENGLGITLVRQVRSSEKGPGQTLVRQVRSLEKGQALVRQVRRMDWTEPWLGRFRVRKKANFEPGFGQVLSF